MKYFFRFLTSRIFLINAVISIALVLGVFWALFSWIDSYTEHGETVTVPSFLDQRVEELDDFVASKPVNYKIIDSIFDYTLPKGIVVDQDPAPELQVKRDRIVYLTINALQPELIVVPKVKDLTLKGALGRLENSQLVVDSVRYEPYQFARALWVERNGLKLEQDARIPKGSNVVLVVGKEAGVDDLLAIPDLTGLTLKQVKAKLLEQGLKPGAVLFTQECENASDSARAKLYEQDPYPTLENGISPGGSIDLFFSTDSLYLYRAPKDSI